MSSIHESAYPRFKPNLTEKELAEIYTPSTGELNFVHQRLREHENCLLPLVYIKTCQRLGYFVSIADVPNEIIIHIANIAGASNFCKNELHMLSRTGSGQRYRDLARTYLNLKAFNSEADSLSASIAKNAAQTKQELADIINVMIEELVRQRFELPGFRTLYRTASKARSTVNNNLYNSIYLSLSTEMATELDTLLKVENKDIESQWSKIKEEPKKPTNMEVRNFLSHLDWLKSWVSRLPPIDHISAGKWRQFVLESRALDAADLRYVKPAKRYFLIVILIHSQLRCAMDDTVTILIRKMNLLHSRANQQLQQYHIEQSAKTESLISQFRDVLLAYGEGESDAERISAIKASFRDDPKQLSIACEEHMAYAGNNYIPFMLGSYRQQRPLLLNCVKLLNAKSSSNDLSIVAAIQFVLRNRDKHKTKLSLKIDELDLSWLPEKWRKLVTGKSSTTAPVTEIHRLYFELCVLSQVVNEIKSGDLFVENSEQYNDYRDQLISWNQYEGEVKNYGKLVGFSTDSLEFVAKLKDDLTEAAVKTDRHFPENELVEISKDGLTIHKHDKVIQPEKLQAIDNAIMERMSELSILDVLIETESWLGLHNEFGPISGFESKIDNPKQRFIATLFCYGCNLGPVQTARSVKDISRKQIAWLNLHHITEAKLEQATEKVINAYNKFFLPKYWGSGKHASADGTKWNVYEQNLLSEYHIRYGGYGGIGYYHVSDMYIALFSHFIPCGVYEAVYILDGLVKNESDIQPDTIHGDTQAQNTAVFGLAYLLGINLMPRIRGLKKLIFFRADKETRYSHIDSLFGDVINWQLIETHLPDMLRIVLSIKAGKITPSTILRRLGTNSRKNKLYFAFRELGRVVRTIFLLKYVGDVEIRRTVQSATNKSEEFNNFSQWSFFGSGGVIAENVRHEQRKIIKYNHLVANMVILHNVEGMTKVLKNLQDEGMEITQEILAGLSPYRTHHINRFGDYTLDIDREIRQMDFSTRII